MNYKGFTIIKDCCGTFKVRITIREEWLAVDLRDAQRQVDEYLRKISFRKVA